MSVTPYTLPSGNIIQIIDGLNMATNYFLFPSLLLALFSISFLLNRSNVFIAFSFSSLLVFFVSLVFYSIFTTFDFGLVMLSMFLVVISVVMNFLWR